MTTDYTSADPMTLDPTVLRTLITERAHHTLEVQLYEALAGGEPLSLGAGDRVRELLDAWERRGLPGDHPNLKWARAMLELAESMLRGEKVDLSAYASAPFDGAGREAIDHLIFQRRSVRWWTDQDVPECMIDRILEAGLWSIHSCNLSSMRFLVVREKSLPGLLKGHHTGVGPVHVVLCQDRRAYYCMPRFVANPERIDYSRLLDCGAAMQNMALMAHALGLGAVWLGMRPAEVDPVREHFQLPDHIHVIACLDVGFPAQTPMPPGRITIEDATLARV